MTDQPRDLARYLPLSIRQRVDESAVSNDWRARLEALAAALDELPTGDERTMDAMAVIQRARARRRVRVTDLGDALVAVYQAAGDGIAVDPVTSGAVCLARALAAPLPIRSVVTGRTLTATDAGWELGTGPRLPGTARELTLFLYGRGPLPGGAA